MADQRRQGIVSSVVIIGVVLGIISWVIVRLDHLDAQEALRFEALKQTAVEATKDPCDAEFIQYLVSPPPAPRLYVIVNGQTVEDINKLRWRKDGDRIVFYEGHMGQADYVDRGFKSLHCQ